MSPTIRRPLAIDWHSVTALVAERSQKPVVVLDRRGRVRLLSTPMEDLLGWQRFELEGRVWTTVATPLDAPADRRWLERAFRGGLAQHRCQILTRSGAQLRVRLALDVAGRGNAQALLMMVLEVAHEEPETFSHDLDYRVTRSPIFGQIEALAGLGAKLQAPPEKKCFEVLYGRVEPCEDCPVLANGRTAVRSRDGGRLVEVANASVEGASAKVSVRTLPSASLAAIHHSKVDELARNARLTRREHDIFRRLLLGASLAEIAGDLRLSTRTVKFHQANVLEKLGVESRLDLVQLVQF